MGFKYSSASRYLLKEHGASGSLFGGFGAISLNTSLELKRKLKEKNPDLGVIRSGINAQAETAKQINLVWVIITFVLSAILSPTVFYLGQSLKVSDWEHESKMYIYKEALKSVEDVGKQADYLSKAISEDALKFTKELKILQEAQGKVLLILIGMLLAGFAVFFLRYQWIISLKECIENAYAEQDKRLAEKKEEGTRATAAIKEKKEKELKDAALIVEIRNKRLMKKS
ncbi:hypothetical protein QUF95_07175 [Paenibacillus silvae]|uniref:hypothetical protein n=1 Tax=Paenibacillus silvae TaxID=1325358 RepID=UPI0025A2509F|nr:hypothetical protein [Paenibacillus silvae]MDM5277157.1 hypothetical protein [Paenibacillus silvae]